MLIYVRKFRYARYDIEYDESQLIKDFEQMEYEICKFREIRKTVE